MRTTKRPNLKSIALPAEHGGWGFLLEPILLGLIVAFTPAALLFSLAMLAAFLIHQPLKIAAKDRIKGQRTERTRWAERFLLLYGGLAGSLLGLLIAAHGLGFLRPLGVALPLVFVQVGYDARNQSRALVPELSGAAALGAIASSIALLDGWQLWPALLLWSIVVLRAIPAILYVRARLRLERSKPITRWPTHAAHGLALALSLPFILDHQIPVVVSVALGVLLIRAAWGLSNYRTPAARPAVIGIQELLYGIAYVIVIGVGYLLV